MRSEINSTCNTIIPHCLVYTFELKFAKINLHHIKYPQQNLIMAPHIMIQGVFFFLKFYI